MVLNLQKNKKEAAKKKGILLIIISVVMVSLLLTYIIFSEKEKLDNFNCPRTGPEAKTVVIIDTSDPLTDIQTQLILVKYVIREKLRVAIFLKMPKQED